MATIIHFNYWQAVKTARVVFPPCPEETGHPDSRSSLGDSETAVDS